MHRHLLKDRWGPASVRSTLWVQIVVLCLVCSQVLLGCVHVEFAADYQSNIKHEPLPLRTSITVLVSSELRQELDDDDEQIMLERVRSTLQTALRKDFEANGPLDPVARDPQARMVVTLNQLDYTEHKLWIMMWFLAPLWLFGVPMHKLNTSLGVDIKLVSWKGEQMWTTKEKADCSQHQGLYYGNRNLSFGCPARQITERLREYLSANRAEVLARMSRRPQPVKIPFRKRGHRPIALVFQIQDMSGQIESNLLLQLTEYLSTQVAQKLDLMVVPRSQVRQKLLVAKKESHRACYERSCQIELGRRLAANMTVSSTLIHVGSRCVLNTTLIDLKTEATIQAASAESTCSPDALLDGVKKVVERLQNNR